MKNSPSFIVPRSSFTSRLLPCLAVVLVTVGALTPRLGDLVSDFLRARLCLLEVERRAQPPERLIAKVPRGHP